MARGHTLLGFSYGEEDSLTDFSKEKMSCPLILLFLGLVLLLLLLLLHGQTDT